MGGARSGRYSAAWSKCDFARLKRARRETCATLLGVVALSLAAITPAKAIDPPSSVQPGKVEREYQNAPNPPRPSPNVTVPSLEQQGPPANAESVRFVLKSVEIDGNTVLSDEALARPFASLVGQEVSLAQMFQAANEVTRMYVRAGYALSLAFVPAQEVKNGSVRVRVVEGYIGEVEFQDERTFHSKLWAGFADRLQASRPLKTKDLERYLLLANDLAGVEVKSVFERMDGDPGATRLVMMIERKLVDAGVEVNNRGSEAIGPVRVQLNAALNGLIGAEERIGLFGVRVPDGEELAYLAGRLDVPLTSDGFGASFNVSRSHSKVGRPVNPALDFQTDGWAGDLMFSYPVIRSRAQNLYASLGVNYKDLSSDIIGFENTHDTMTVIVAGVDYDTTDRWGGLLQAVGTLRVGLDVFDATQSNDPRSSRPGASGEFIRLEATVSRLQSFRPWLHLYAQLDAQVADGSLLVSEQCGYGGGSIGRAFDPFEIAGDHCVKGIAELRYDMPLSDWGFDGWMLSAMQIYGLADFGYVFRSGDLLVGEERNDSGASVGLGMRVRALEYVSGLIEVAHPLGHGVELQNGSDEPRVFFGLSLDY
jgi:hemolysin activation/secretion protein